MKNSSKNRYSRLIFSYLFQIFVYFGLFWFVLNYWSSFFVQVPSSRNFSLVVRYSLKFTRCSLLVVKSLVTRCKIYSLLVAEESLVTHRRSCSLQNSLVTCYRSCPLQKITRYLLPNSLVTHCRSFLLQKIARYSLQNLLDTRYRSCSLQKITRCKICSLLVEEVVHCKKSLFTRYKIGLLLVIEVESLFTTLLKKVLQHRCFPVNFCEILRTHIL